MSLNDITIPHLLSKKRMLPRSLTPKMRGTLLFINHRHSFGQGTTAQGLCGIHAEGQYRTGTFDEGLNFNYVDGILLSNGSKIRVV